LAELIGAGLDKTRVLYLNFDDERLLPMGAADLRKIPETYYRLFPSHKRVQCQFLFDEIQRVEGWEYFVRRLLDTERVRICLTGSSSKLLSTEISTRLRGRSLTTEIFPFDFCEFLRFHGVDAEPARPQGSAAVALLENRFKKYLLTGGFPEVQREDEETSRQILQGYVDVVILRDVVERHGISNALAMRHLIRHILNAPATRFSVNKFYNTLRSLSVSCTKDSLYEYLDHLTDAYLLFCVPVFSRSEKARLVNPRKVYAIDTGLIQALSRRPQPDLGALLENLVFLRLRRAGADLAYHVTEGGGEVDFVVTPRKGTLRLIQVCWELEDPDTAEREVGSLTAAMQELRVRRGTIVTAYERKTMETSAGKVEVVPAWDWLLGAGQGLE
jgi:hypothetical protein